VNPEVGAWLAKADEDRAAARCLARADDPLLLPAVFHVQQSAEKFLKALLIGKGIDFGRKHDLAYLREMAQESSLDAFADFLEQLTPYAVEVRYPGDFTPPSADHAAELLRKLEELRALIFAKLGC
jgi:HEPN domain-containing protein